MENTVQSKSKGMENTKLNKKERAQNAVLEIVCDLKTILYFSINNITQMYGLKIRALRQIIK